ncbi:MAG TPA: V-type ATP synthase subunit F [Bacillota bacterium]|nr:V-type ATP synthase subunit F [Bacillota bacterium]
MYKIGLIGDRDTIMGFRALGLDTYEVITREDTIEAMNQVMNNDYALIFMTERIFALIPDLLREYRDRSLPVINIIPDNRGNLGLGMKRMRSMVEKAVGADILFKEEGK